LATVFAIGRVSQSHLFEVFEQEFGVVEHLPRSIS